MAIANKCDRCNIFFEPKGTYNRHKDVYHDIVIRKVDYKETLKVEKTIELCPECYESLMAWAEDGKELQCEDN